jgi:hypothetical protein
MKNKNWKKDKNKQILTRIKAVQAVINEWNPYSLLPDAGENEYIDEVRQIVGRIKPDNSVEMIAEVVSDVFINAFGNEQGFTKESCKDVALKIKSVFQPCLQ